MATWAEAEVLICEATLPLPVTVEPPMACSASGTLLVPRNGARPPGVEMVSELPAEAV